MITPEELLNNDWPLSLAMSSNGEESFDGSCPCAVIRGVGFTVETHCWRSCCEHDCKYSGIHVSGTISKRMKQKIAKHVRDNNGWTNSTEWIIIIT